MELRCGAAGLIIAARTEWEPETEWADALQGEWTMKAVVNADTCIGCGLCAETCPAVFAMEGSVAKPIVESVPADAQAACREAAEACPVEAIVLDA